MLYSVGILYQLNAKVVCEAVYFALNGIMRSVKV